MLGRDHSVGQETDFSAGEEKMDSEGAASVGTVGSAGSQEQGDPALRLYLNLIRDVPVLSREETAVLSEKIAQGEADFRNAMNRIPAVALRLISMWEDRRKDGRNTGLLAHGYHGDARTAVTRATAAHEIRSRARQPHTRFAQRRHATRGHTPHTAHICARRPRGAPRSLSRRLLNTRNASAPPSTSSRTDICRSRTRAYTYR